MELKWEDLSLQTISIASIVCSPEWDAGSALFSDSWRELMQELADSYKIVAMTSVINSNGADCAVELTPSLPPSAS